MREFSPLEAFEQALRGWWLVVIATILGGLLGWAVHSVLPPLYEARAAFSISLDFKQTGALSQFDEDHAYNTVGALIYSTPVMDEVAKQASQQDIPIDRAGLLKVTSTERKEYTWVLKARDPHASTAARLANLWAEEANRQLGEAFNHAQKAATWRQYQEGLERCLGLRPALPTGENLCGMASWSDLQTELQNATGQYQSELGASRGMISALAFNLSQKAEIPSAPIARGTNSLVLAGGLIGFVAGIWGAQAKLPAGLGKGWRRA